MYMYVAGDGYGPNVMFSDGETIGHIAASRDVSDVRNVAFVCYE